MVRRLPIPLPRDAALIVIDLQRAIDHASWGQRNNLDAERNVAALLFAWRTSERPVYHVRHDSAEPASHYRPGRPPKSTP
jgi:nicotinamidase-related amidase